MSIFTRLLRFALVGGFCFFVQWALVHELKHVAHLFLAGFVAFMLSAQLNFLLSQLFTWGDRKKDADSLLMRWFRYNIVALALGVLNAFLFMIARQFLGIPEGMAVLLAVAICTCLSFLFNHFFVFLEVAKVPFMEYLEVDLSKELQAGIAIFMPAFNEGANLRTVVTDAVSWLLPLDVPFNVIVIDDGSSDDTINVVEQLQVTFPEVRLVQHETNRGYGAALITGLKASLQTGHDWIGFCDADGQFQPSEFSKLVTHAVNQEADICIGYRIKRADGLKRWLMGRAWHLVSKLILGYQATDVDCGFKLFRRHSVARLAHQLIGGYATISPEILTRAYNNGEKIVEIGVQHYPRGHGEQSGADLKVILGSLRGLLLVKQSLTSEPKEV